MKRRYVSWDQDTKQKVKDAFSRLPTDLPFSVRIVQAQQVLPEEQRRTIKDAVLVPWLQVVKTPKPVKEKKVSGLRKSLQQLREEVANLKAEVENLRYKVLHWQNRSGVQQAAPMPEATTTRRRVIFIGAIGVQKEELQRTFKEIDFVFVDAGNIRQLQSIGKDVPVLCTRFTNHDVAHTLGRKVLRLPNGGITTWRQVIEQVVMN